VTPIAPRHRGPTPPELRQPSGAAGHAPVSPASRPFADGSVSPGRREDKGPPVNVRLQLGVGGPATAGRGRTTRACTERQPIGLPHWPGAERRPFGVGATARRRPEGGLWRLRRVRPGPARRPLHLPGPLRPPAPRAGVGGDRGGGRPVDHRRQGHGSRPQRLQRADARRAAGPLRHRPHPPAPGATPSPCSARPAASTSPSATTAT